MTSLRRWATRACRPEDVEAVMAAGDGLVLFKGKWVELDRARLQEAIVHRDSLRRDVGEGGISFIEGVRLLLGASRRG